MGMYVRIVSLDKNIYYGKVSLKRYSLIKILSRLKRYVNLYYLSYNGWASSHDEWVPESHIEVLQPDEATRPNRLQNPAPNRSSKTNHIVDFNEVQHFLFGGTLDNMKRIKRSSSALGLDYSDDDSPIRTPRPAASPKVVRVTQPRSSPSAPNRRTPTKTSQTPQARLAARSLTNLFEDDTSSESSDEEQTISSVSPKFSGSAPRARFQTSRLRTGASSSPDRRPTPSRPSQRIEYSRRILEAIQQSILNDAFTYALEKEPFHEDVLPISSPPRNLSDDDLPSRMENKDEPTFCSQPSSTRRNLLSVRNSF